LNRPEFNGTQLCLFPLYLSNRLTFDLDFCVYVGHECRSEVKVSVCATQVYTAACYHCDVIGCCLARRGARRGSYPGSSAYSDWQWTWPEHSACGRASVVPLILGRRQLCQELVAMRSRAGKTSQKCLILCRVGVQGPPPPPVKP